MHVCACERTWVGLCVRVSMHWWLCPCVHANVHVRERVWAGVCVRVCASVHRRVCVSMCMSTGVRKDELQKSMNDPALWRPCCQAVLWFYPPAGHTESQDTNATDLRLGLGSLHLLPLPCPCCSRILVEIADFRIMLAIRSRRLNLPGMSFAFLLPRISGLSSALLSPLQGVGW